MTGIESAAPEGAARGLPLLNGAGEPLPAATDAVETSRPAVVVVPVVDRPRLVWRNMTLDDRTAKIEEVRQLVEGTELSQGEIARRCEVSPTLVSTWKHRFGWKRPEGAPRRPDFGGTATDPLERVETRRQRLLQRLYRIFDRQAGGLEARAKTLGATTEEKDARTLGVLAKTLQTLMELDRDGAKVGEPERTDRDLEEIDADLARRIDAWASGGEVS